MADQSFFWYDLETSGVNPREQRIMQFAGQRTDMQLNPVGEPVNVLIKLSDDVLPEPDAILITGITPQKVISEGVTEAEFLKLFHEQVATPDTVFVGYNSIRFDDEFVRYLNYRNFYDPYQWQWKDGRSRWDLLDVVRMTRALRPEGIKWPFDSAGKPSNRLELLTSVNGLDHANAHDALSDVYACIALAKLLHEKQPKLFDYLLSLRDKKKVEEFVRSNQQFLYTSGKYPSEFEKTTVVTKLADHPKRSAALVYDLREVPTEFLNMKPAELAERWQWTRDENAPPRLPVKTLRYNVCPSVAPLSVLDSESQKRIKLDMKKIDANLAKLVKADGFVDRIYQALELLDKKQQTSAFANPQEVDAQLYDGFLDDHDGQQLPKVVEAAPQDLTTLAAEFHDSRLQHLLPLYKARNFAKQLTDEERKAWEDWRMHRLLDGGEKSRVSRFMNRLQELSTTVEGGEKRYLLEELQLYAESIMPLADDV